MTDAQHYNNPEILPADGSKEIEKSTLQNLNSNNDFKSLAARDKTSNSTFEDMLDIPVELIFEVGKSNITIRELMELDEGSFVELKNVAVDIIDIKVNDKTIGVGEAILLQKKFGIRFGEIELFPGKG